MGKRGRCSFCSSSARSLFLWAWACVHAETHRCCKGFITITYSYTYYLFQRDSLTLFTCPFCWLQRKSQMPWQCCFTLRDCLARSFFSVVFSSLIRGCVRQEINGAVWAVRKQASSCDSLYQLTVKLQVTSVLSEGRRAYKYCVKGFLLKPSLSSTLLERHFGESI